MRGFVFIVSLILLGHTAISQTDRKHLRDGNQAYQDEKYRDAEVLYRKSLEKNPRQAKATYNLGNALYKQEAYEEAIQQFSIAGESGSNHLENARAYHNLGNSYVKQEKLNEAAAAYKQALRLNPSDEDTRHNLSWVLKRLQESQQDQQNQQEKQDQEDQKDQQNQQKQEQQNQQDRQEQQQQQPSQKNQQISKEDAERMLQALKNDEQKTLDKVKKQIIPAERQRIEKDW